MEITSQEDARTLHSPAQASSVPQETYRVLLAWLELEEAVQIRSALISDTPENHAQAVAACHARVAARPAFTASNPVTEVTHSDLVEAVRARPEFAFIETEVLGEDAAASCRIALVNLDEVLALQPIVRIDHLEHRLFQQQPDEKHLFGLCFPPGVSTDTVTIDSTHRGYTITTLDPNMRVVPWTDLPLNPPPALPTYKLQFPSAAEPLPTPLFPFALLRKPNFLQVVHFQDRYILRDGYTRASALLYQHIHTVPCVLIETQDPDLIFKHDMIDPDIMMGDHPPLLKDFWDDSLTCLWQRPAIRKIYHIHLEELEVWR